MGICEHRAYTQYYTSGSKTVVAGCGRSEAHPAPTGAQIAGQDRVQTAVEVSKFGWGNADSVVIATARQFPDALVGGPLAALLDAPILLSEPGRLPSVVRAEIQRLGASSAVILGGRSAVGDAVVDDDLVGLGIARNQIVRIGGSDRYDTARLVAHHECDTTGLGNRAVIPATRFTASCR